MAAQAVSQELATRPSADITSKFQYANANNAISANNYIAVLVYDLVRS